MNGIRVYISIRELITLKRFLKKSQDWQEGREFRNKVYAYASKRYGEDWDTIGLPELIRRGRQSNSRSPGFHIAVNKKLALDIRDWCTETLKRDRGPEILYFWTKFARLAQSHLGVQPLRLEERNE